MKSLFQFLILCLFPFTVLAQPDPAKARLAELISARDFRAAAQLADSLTGLNPNDFIALYQGGIAWSNLLKFDKAAVMFQRADSISPDNKAVLSNLADCYFESIRLKEAEAVVNRIILMDSLDTSPWIQLSKIMVRQGRIPQAIAVYSRLWQADSANLWYPRQISMMLVRNENYKEACQLLEYIVDKDSSDIESYLRLGQSYLRLNPTGKVPYLDKAIRQDSTISLLYRYRGGLSLFEGDFVRAEKDFVKAASLGDSSAFTMRHLGISQFHLSKYEPALAAFSATVKIDSTDAQAWYYLGFCYKWTQDVTMAIQCLERALKISIPPFTAGIFSGLGQFHSLSRDFKKAIEYYEKSLEFNPDDPVPHAQIGLLLEESFGDRTVAKQHYETFLKQYKGPDLNLVRYVESRIQAINERLFMEGNLKK
jgi:tetratricopeptide (TPR) repeat protein